MSDGGQSRLKGVLIAHGDMARGLTDAVRKISGHGEDVLVPLSNDGRTPQRLREELEAILGEGPAVVFTDLYGGSCALTAFAACRPGQTLVICGANLPMLLDFVFNRDMPLPELSGRLLETGKRGIRVHPWTNETIGAGRGAVASPGRPEGDAP